MLTLYHLALMAEDIYPDDKSAIYSASFQTSVPQGLPNSSDLQRIEEKSDDGFAAAVYACGDSAAITFRGTDMSGASVPMQEASEKTPQFARAVSFAEKAIQTHDLVQDRTYICGHSLGGALTKYVAHHLAQSDWLAAAAVSFNAPGLTVSLLDKALVGGMSRLTEDMPIGVGIRAVYRLMQQVDIPADNQTDARLVNVNLNGDIVSRVGEASGRSYALDAPEFVAPEDFEIRNVAGFPRTEQGRTVVLREVYLHSMHTLRRVLAEAPLGLRDPRDLA